MIKNQFALLKTRRFVPLFFAQFLGMFNDHLFKSGLMVFITFNVVSSAKHAQMLINVAGGLYALSFLLCSSLGGQIADKFNRTRLARHLQFIELLFVLAAAVGFYFQYIWLLLIILFLMGAQAAFFGPVKLSSLPNLLNKDELIGGNALIEASTILSVLCGTILGTLLGKNIQGALHVVAVTATSAAIAWISTWFIPQIPAAKADLKIGINIFGEIIRSIKYIRIYRVLLITILEISWFVFVTVSIVTQFPVFAKNIIGGNEKVIALLLLMFTFGIATGSLICNRLLKGVISPRLLPFAIVGMTLFAYDLYWVTSSITEPFMAMGMKAVEIFKVHPGPRICVDIYFLAVCSGVYIVPLYAILQAYSDPEHRARVIACNNVFASSFGVASSAVVVSLVAFNYTTPEIFLLMSVLNACVAIAILANLWRMTWRSHRKFISSR